MASDHITMMQFEEGSKSPSHVCALRRSMLHANQPGRPRSLASVFVDQLTACVNEFSFHLSKVKNLSDLSMLPPTKRLYKLLHMHAKFCQFDEILAEELGREGSHSQLIQIVQLPIDDETILETNRDVMMELQDMACSIAAGYDTFPMRATPFTLEELHQRLPLTFDICPVLLDETMSIRRSQAETILIQQVTKRQSAQEDVGFVLWPSAVVLSRWVASNEHIFQKTVTVLELGAGCGLVGLFVARILQNRQTALPGRSPAAPPTEASQVVLSDFNPSVLDNLKRNIALNNLSDICTTRGLDFYGQPGMDQSSGAETRWVDMDGISNSPVDIVLGADIICQKSDAVAASRTIFNALRPGGYAYIVCATSAHRFGVEIFANECSRSGLTIHSHDVASLYEGSLLNDELEKTTGYVRGMEMTLFTIEKRLRL